MKIVAFRGGWWRIFYQGRKFYFWPSSSTYIFQFIHFNESIRSDFSLTRNFSEILLTNFLSKQIAFYEKHYYTFRNIYPKPVDESFIVLQHSKAQKLSITGPLGFIENKGQSLIKTKTRTDALYVCEAGNEGSTDAEPHQLRMFTWRMTTVLMSNGQPDWNQSILRSSIPDFGVKQPHWCPIIGAIPILKCSEEMMPDYLIISCLYRLRHYRVKHTIDHLQNLYTILT